MKSGIPYEDYMNDKPKIAIRSATIYVGMAVEYTGICAPIICNL